MDSIVIGVDIGTGSTKAVAVNADGKPLFLAQNYYPVLNPEAGYSEQDPDLIWQAFIKSLKEALEFAPGAKAICISSAMHSLIAADKNGLALMNMLTWADARSGAIADELHQSPEGEEIYRKTGTPVHPMSPLCKLIWLQQHKPRLFKEAYKFISIKEYIWYKLFGKFQIDYSIASATGLFDIEKLIWDKQALQLAGIDEDRLSQPVSTYYSEDQLSSEAATLLNTSAGIPFIIGASDGCLANLGSFAVKPQSAALTIGTSGAVRIACNAPVINYEAMIFNYRLDEEIIISGGAVNNGGNIIQWFLKNILGHEELNDEVYKEFFSGLTTIPAGSEGLIFTPYLHGERAPVWDIKTCGNFLGLKPEHSSHHLSRAVVEGICFALNDVLYMVEHAASSRVTHLNVSGGFVASKEWLQILADITGKELNIEQTEDASSLGAAFMAMKGINLISSYDELPQPAASTTITPGENVQLYQPYFVIYQQLYRNLKRSMHQLYHLNAKQ